MSTTHRPTAGLWKTLVCEDDGQDLIEYGLLSAIIAIAGILVLPGIFTKMGNAFSAQGNLGTGIPSLWIPNSPL